MLKTLVQPAVAHGSALAIANKTGALHTAANLDLSQYLLSQCTIVCSVYPEIAHGPNGPYNIIDQSCNHLVNQNGDAWLNQVLLETYGTFRGAFNFLEHNQILSENKGRVLDAVLRDVKLVKADPTLIDSKENDLSSSIPNSIESFLQSIQPRVPTPKPNTPQKIHTNTLQYMLDAKGQPKFVYYVDILVATSLQFTRLIEQILDGEYNAMSMGCVVQGSTCSYCGHQILEPYPSFCPCLLQDRGTLKLHPEKKRLVAVAELCGIPSRPETNSFIEASWVLDPAFIGARRAYLIDLPENLKKTTYFIPAQPELKNIQKASSLKAASAHESVYVDMQTMRNTAQSFARNKMLRDQLNRYLVQYGFNIAPIPGRSSYPVQRVDQDEFTKTQALFKQLGLR